MRRIIMFAVSFLVAFSLTIFLPACNKNDDGNTCADAVNNAWKIVEKSSESETCDALFDLLLNTGIYWPGGTYDCGSFYDDYGTYIDHWYIPEEEYFKADIKSFCEDGSLSSGDQIEEEGWDQDSIDCNAEADSLAELGDC